jgi:broad specificity phosphatase PhoE
MPAFDTDHPTATFCIMRHAPTEWNRAGRIQGQADSPLTPAGKVWATRWGSQLTNLGLQRILSSDTGRAMATARHINQTLQLPLAHDARLREQDWGQWTGQTMAAIRTQHRDLFSQQENRGWSFCPPGGEERLVVLTRARKALWEAGRKWPGERLLVVTHEGVLKCIVYHLAIIHSCGQAFGRMAPYHLHRLAITGNSLRLDQMNALAFRPPAA